MTEPLPAQNSILGGFSVKMVGVKHSLMNETSFEQNIMLKSTNKQSKSVSFND